MGVLLVIDGPGTAVDSSEVLRQMAVKPGALHVRGPAEWTVTWDSWTGMLIHGRVSEVPSHVLRSVGLPTSSLSDGSCCYYFGTQRPAYQMQSGQGQSRLYVFCVLGV